MCPPQSKIFLLPSPSVRVRGGRPLIRYTSLLYCPHTRLTSPAHPPATRSLENPWCFFHVFVIICSLSPLLGDSACDMGLNKWSRTVWSALSRGREKQASERRLGECQHVIKQRVGVARACVCCVKCAARCRPIRPPAKQIDFLVSQYTPAVKTLE